MSGSDKKKDSGYRHMGEPALIEKVKSGDVKSFDELVRRYSLFVIKRIRKFAREDIFVEELFQNVFITVYYKINTYKGDGSFSSWLSAVINNEWRMYLRQIVKKHMVPKREEELENIDSKDAVNIDEALEFREISGKIDAAIDKLPPHYAEVIIKSAIEGKSYDTIADESGLTRSQVKSRLFRARKMLEKMLEEYFGG